MHGEENFYMSAEENKDLVRRFFEARIKADLNALEEMMAPDFISHGMFPGQQPGHEGFKRAIVEVSAAFSDRRFVIEDQLVAGDKVVSRYSVHVTQDRGEYMGVAPTGREVEFKVIAIHRIEGGKIAEEWGAGTSGAELMGQRLEQERIERERIEQELEVARRIQHALLPNDVPALVGWEISPYYQPAREVGGDFYDFVPLADGRVSLVMGDVSGKGVPAAVLMSSTQSVIRALAQRGDPSPSRVLSEANEVLCTYIPPNMFVTCFYAILDPNSGSLRYANAGHDLPYLHRTSGEEDAEELRATGMPLGLMSGMGYEEKETIVEAGEAALFYSDGIVEAHNPKGEMFGFPRLRALIAEYAAEGSLGDFLMEELYSFVGEGWEQEDDITLL